jgi:hypothetical protein
MTVNDEILSVLSQMTPERQKQVLEYAKNLTEISDDEWWRLYGAQRFEGAFDADEPDYTSQDCKVLRP